MLAAAIALVIKLRADDVPARRDTPEPTTRTREAPRLPERDRTVAEDRPTVVTETVVNGARVRDHRGGEQVPYQPRSRDPVDAHGVRLPSQLVHDLSDKLKSAMTECTTAIPAEARGGRPRIEGSIFVDVTGGQVMVKEAAIELRDVTGDVAAAKQCLERKWIGQTTPAGDTADTSHYAISVVFAVP